MEVSKLRGLVFFPILNLLLFLTTLGVSSVLARRQDGVWVTTLPFISDTGALPPASCWFTLLLNASAYSLAITGIFRFMEIQHRLKRSRNILYPHWLRPFVNFISLFLIAVGCMGLSMVAAFQETNVIVMHKIGALTAFWCAVGYTIIQCFFSLTFLIEEMSGPSVMHRIVVGARLVLSGICVISFALMQIFMRRAGPTLPPHRSGVYGSTTEKPPYTDAVAYYFTTADEWILGISFFTFISTLCYDFWKLEASISIQCKHFECY